MTGPTDGAPTGTLTCDDARLLLSAELDGEAAPQPEALAAHTAGCVGCAAFATTGAQLRRELRVVPVDDVPDIAARVRRELDAERAAASTVARAGSATVARTGARAPGPRPPMLRRLLPVAAALLVGFLAGALLVSGGDGGHVPSAVAATLPDRILAAQHDVTSLRARVEVREHGWNPAVRLRTFDGTLSYEAPESLALELRDTSGYPDASWRRNDVVLVAEDGARWTQGLRDCPSVSQPACTPEAARLAVTTGRAPFSPTAPTPLELVVPVAALGDTDAPVAIGERRVDGRDAVGVRVTAAQASGLLGALRPAGNLREVHPSDTVDLWLDADALVPLEVVVTASDAPGRDRWATNHGYTERADEVVLEVRLRDVTIGGPLPGDPFRAAPAGGVVRDEGFVDVTPAPPAGLVLPGTPGGGPLPDGLEPHRAGQTTAPAGGGDETGGPAPATTTWSWVDGRAWLTVEATTSWSATRLFGDLGPATREVRLDAAAGAPDAEAVTAYLDAASGKVALHGDGIDVVVAGTIGIDGLEAVAARLGVPGLPVPADWEEAAAVSPAEAADALGGLRLPPTPMGFRGPVLRLDERFGDPVVVARWTGPGDRAFALSAWEAERLGPPLDPDVAGVEIRGIAGRTSPTRAELEWVEDGVAYRLAGPTVALTELAGIAETMEPVR